jgi:phytoene dehydrogenase-like protein
MSDAVIVGAGLAGLACARELSRSGVSCTVLEASDGVGGRARTDGVDGFLLDRGFQVLLTAYPEARRVLDYEALELRGFEPGALVRWKGGFHRIADPWRRPLSAIGAVFSPMGTFRDKLRLGKLRGALTKDGGEAEASKEISTMQFLRDYGFSENLIERFFRPFLGGIFLERELETESAMFAFVFRMFSLGEGAIPARGMGAMAQQMADQLPGGSVQLRQSVAEVAAGSVKTTSGESIPAKAIVVATDESAAARLLPEVSARPFRATTCFYFAAEKAPVAEPMLVLNGEGKGPINNLCVPSLVAPSYAPAGAHLISASVVGAAKSAPDELLRQVKDQMAEWFGPQTRRWRHLRTDWIPQALPQARRTGAPVRAGVYVCGDYCETASINGALVSGRKAAEAVRAEMRG